jgi:Protein of unknown function (DUF3298)/Deacetylase PdaC
MRLISFFKKHSHKVRTYVIIGAMSFFIVGASFWYKSQRQEEQQMESSSFLQLLQKKEQGVHEKKPGYGIDVDYPRFSEAGSDKANALIREEYRSKVHDFRRGAEEVFVEASKNPRPENTPSYYVSSSVEISKTERYVSLLVSEEFYTIGAAHPLRARETYIFDRQEKRLVTAPELFVASSSYLTLLSDISRAEFKKQARVAQEQGTEEAAIDTSKDNHGFDPVPSNFSRILPTENGLMVYFEVYQVGPYSSGLQEVLIPYEKLRGVLSKDGVLGGEIK